MGSTNKLIVAMLGVAVLAAAFWVLALGPKRQEASELSVQVRQAQESLAQHSAEAEQAAQARREFPVDYQQLVILGKAAPGDDDAASLLVQLNQIAAATGVRFQNISLNATGGEAPPAAAPPAAGAGGTPISATEVAASTLPLGATIGPAGLAVMPYELTFKGDFFRVADFVKGLDSLVETEDAKVDVHGRLITIDGFSLAADSSVGFPALEATFRITTFLTPPSQGVTAGATPESPESATGTPAATTTGGTP